MESKTAAAAAAARGGVVVVHGGAKDVPKDVWDLHFEGVKAAALQGYEVVSSGGSVVDAVEAAVIVLEDFPIFNAGRGSALTLEEEVEMDALIMSGQGLKAGAVAVIRNVKNPVKVARLVMERTPHVMLAGDAATRFAVSQGIDKVPTDTLVTSMARQRLKTFKKYTNTVDQDFNVLIVDKRSSNKDESDTVGCAAVDVFGNTACATSTGGITAKMPGRVGDSPLPGSGGYADDQVGAVSTTGHGESIMKVCLAQHITSLMATGKTVSSSIEQSLDNMCERVEGCGGAVGVSREGDVGVGFSTPCMPWAYVKDGTLHYGIAPGQHLTEPL